MSQGTNLYFVSNTNMLPNEVKLYSTWTENNDHNTEVLMTCQAIKIRNKVANFEIFSLQHPTMIHEYYISPLHLSNYSVSLLSSLYAQEKDNLCQK